MPIWTGPRDVVVDLVNRFCAVVPPEIANPSRTDNQDDIYALGEQMACAEGMTMWLSREMEPACADNTFLSTLARGVGLSRQSGEGDPALLARIRTPPLTVTLDLIQQALQQIVNGSGLSTDPVLMIELPRSALYYSPPPFDLPRVNPNGNAECYNTGFRFSSARPQTVIALIPAAAASISGIVLAALQAKVTGGKLAVVETYTGD